LRARDLFSSGETAQLAQIRSREKKLRHMLCGLVDFKELPEQMEDKPGSLRLRDVERRLQRAARQFREADFVHRHTAAGIVERMAPVQLDAARVVDLGSATGRDRKILQQRFRKAMVIGIDRSAAMLSEARRHRSWFAAARDIRADAARLPLLTGSIDLVYANLLLPWIDDHAAVFAEAARVLRAGGLFTFATLGPDSFRELRAAWGDTDTRSHVRHFPDMHNVGDQLVHSGLRDPVLDVETLGLEYRDTKSLFRDIARTATGNSLRHRQPSLTGKGDFKNMVERLTKGGAALPVAITLELVFGHAWGAGPRESADEFRVPATAIGRRRRQG
jgi:malonyl-CoA O-methyltransferase